MLTMTPHGSRGTSRSAPELHRGAQSPIGGFAHQRSSAPRPADCELCRLLYPRRPSSRRHQTGTARAPASHRRIAPASQFVFATNGQGTESAWPAGYRWMSHANRHALTLRTGVRKLGERHRRPLDARRGPALRRARVMTVRVKARAWSVASSVCYPSE